MIVWYADVGCCEWGYPNVEYCVAWVCGKLVSSDSVSAESMNSVCGSSECGDKGWTEVPECGTDSSPW